MELWINIFINPGEAIRDITHDFSGHLALIIVALVGALSVFGPGLELSAITMSQNNYFLSLVLLLLAGAVMGVIILYPISLLTYVTGHFLGGEADFGEVTSAIAWSMVPAVLVALLLLIPDFFLLNGLIAGKGANYMEGYQILSNLMKYASEMMGTMIMIRMLAEIEDFSIWKALLHFALTGLALVLLMLFLFLIIFIFAAIFS